MRQVTLISPRWKERGLTSLSIFQLPPMGLRQLESLTPDDWNVRVVDENEQEIDFNAPTDLVGLTGMTCLAPRAYEIAAEFRRRNVPVIMGGIHASVCPDEAQSHVDSVMVGEADLLWPSILNDAAAGSLKSRYLAVQPLNLDFPIHRRVNRIREVRPWRRLNYDLKSLYLQIQRGCPLDCDFCSVTKFNGAKCRAMSVSRVIQEVEAQPSDFLVLVDDNLVANPAYARKLFRALAELRPKRYLVTQADIRITEDEMLKLAIDAGLCTVFIGFEAITKADLSQVSGAKNKWRNEYELALTKLHQAGVLVEGAFIFGFDDQDKSTFPRTLEWAIENQIDIGQFTILTPLPGTTLFKRLIGQGRIRAPFDWAKFSGMNEVFRARGWRAGELEESLVWMYREFYSYSSIWARWSRMPWIKTISRLLINLEFHGYFRP